MDHDQNTGCRCERDCDAGRDDLAMPAGLDGNPNPISSPQRTHLVEELADVIARRAEGGVFRVGVDGIDGGGKSTFADEVAAALSSRGIKVIRSTTDSFHNPRAVRWARGQLSPEGFYLDSHNLEVLCEVLLDPISANPPRPFKTAAFDEPTDAVAEAPTECAADGDVLVFDGLFLQRPELRGYWDLVVYVDGEDRVTRDRIDRVTHACPPDPAGLVPFLRWCAVLGRYVHGFRLYVAECEPQRRAHFVIDNNDFAAPQLRRNGLGPVAASE